MLYLRQRRHHLIAEGQVLVLFVLEITERSGEVELSFDSVLPDEAPSFLDSSLLVNELRFVINT